MGDCLGFVEFYPSVEKESECAENIRYFKLTLWTVRQSCMDMSTSACLFSLWRCIIVSFLLHKHNYILSNLRFCQLMWWGFIIITEVLYKVQSVYGFRKGYGSVCRFSVVVFEKLNTKEFHDELVCMPTNKNVLWYTTWPDSEKLLLVNVFCTSSRLTWTAGLEINGLKPGHITRGPLFVIRVLMEHSNKLQILGSFFSFYFCQVVFIHFSLQMGIEHKSSMNLFLWNSFRLYLTAVVKTQLFEFPRFSHKTPSSIFGTLRVSDVFKPR